MPRDATSLPSSNESEEAILGGVLIDNDLMPSVAETLTVEDFYSPLNRRVFAAMLTLFGQSNPIDPILVNEEIKKEGDSIITANSIANLAFGLPQFSDLSGYIEKVKQSANLRDLIHTCSAVMSDAMTGDYESMERAQAKLNDVFARVGSGERYFPSLQHIIDTEVMQALGDLHEGKVVKIKTGFPRIDSTMGGITPSDVVLIAADTGKGKSALALQLAYNFAKQGFPSAFLAGEMSNKENVLRLLSQLSGVTNLNWLPHVIQTDYEMLVDWAQSIRSVPIYCEHRISDLQTLGGYLRRLVRQHGVKVLVIDYIQLFKMEKLDRRKRNERIAECSQEVKRLANELNIGIIEVAQFNREGAKSAQAGLHDLEGSGQLEKDASVIWILELSDAEFRTASGRKYHDAKIRIVKGRNVGKSEIEGKYYGQSVQFEFD